MSRWVFLCRELSTKVTIMNLIAVAKIFCFVQRRNCFWIWRYGGWDFDVCDNACYLHVQRVALMTSLCGNLDVDKKVVCSVTRWLDFYSILEYFQHQKLPNTYRIKICQSSLKSWYQWFKTKQFYYNHNMVWQKWFIIRH